jgi:uncharacterized protein (TIGR03089 family)
MTTTIPALLAAAIAPDPARPLLTWYDDATGERTELSGATVENWVAKTANLLVDGAGLGPGDTAAVALPPHWQTAAILLGCWSAGLEVLLSAPSPAPSDAPAAPPSSVDVLFGTGEAGTAPERYATALHPFALPMRQLPAGWSDFTLEVRTFGDRFVPPTRVTGTDAALNGGTHAEVCARAAAYGIAAGTRVLIDVDRHPDPVEWLLAPLAAGSSVVLCRHLDPARLAARLSSENATALPA